MLVWADVLCPLSPVSDFLWCRLDAAAVAPEIQPGPEEVRALLNGSAVLPCWAEGWPVPRVTWRKDGRLLPLRRSNRYKALQVGGTKSWLSDRATPDINRQFGMPGAETALSSLRRALLCPHASSADTCHIWLQCYLPPSQPRVPVCCSPAVQTPT